MAVLEANFLEPILTEGQTERSGSVSGSVRGQFSVPCEDRNFEW